MAATIFWMTAKNLRLIGSAPFPNVKGSPTADKNPLRPEARQIKKEDIEIKPDHGHSFLPVTLAGNMGCRSPPNYSSGPQYHSREASPIVDAKFVINCLGLVTDSRRGHTENTGRFLVAFSFSQHPCNFSFPMSQQIKRCQPAQAQFSKAKPLDPWRVFAAYNNAAIWEKVLSR